MSIETSTQSALNVLLGKSLVVDGVLGGESKKAIQELTTKLGGIMQRKGYSPVLSRTLVGIRMDDTYTNKFTDYGILFSGETCLIFPMSTKAGFSYVKNKQYIDGVKGCACLVEGQYKGIWQYRSDGWSGDPYLMQVKPVNIYRDADMDDTITHGQIFTGLYGINFHSWKGFLANMVQNLSAGCQVMQEDYLMALMPYLKEMSAQGNIDYTLIHHKDFA